MCIPYIIEEENSSFKSNADIKEEYHPLGIGPR